MPVRIRLSVLGTATMAAVLVLTACSSPLPVAAPMPASSTQALFPADPSGGDAGSGSGGAGRVTGGGFAMNPDCMGVLSAYSTIALALLPSLSSGQGTYDAGQIAQAISGLGGKVPDALKGDFETLGSAAKAASGKSLTEAGQILGTPAVSAASDDITKWTDANCG
ncbi:hypothetical protein SAMN04515671_1432 [Nakamurella panacisegetis]|uniref:Uncharacterized protein n=1 Tax=Nakamurella panacisegetis TaxID=1090615 RepID=A0A1H0KUR1_9ACTN|nr:hypothetical protein [Nakamurella panacisegetis]SDO59526.1 hypothetical protein SAMN04515671_1432 [Nakamurella panacisegetis]